MVEESAGMNAEESLDDVQLRQEEEIPQIVTMGDEPDQFDMATF